eukprot:TRINITY_DN3271_c0_g1_i1.p2 TRINITY_DN3271_c0_g1~~TRINITY_DN3271_c0_g1_i1.p2  ORF type:complete len:118 (-),score=14.53 TRINITY_DN3271_c0_g1_i1:455-808(-)
MGDLLGDRDLLIGERLLGGLLRKGGGPPRLPKGDLLRPRKPPRGPPRRGENLLRKGEGPRLPVKKVTVITFPSIWPPFKKERARSASGRSKKSTYADPFGRLPARRSTMISALFILP